MPTKKSYAEIKAERWGQPVPPGRKHGRTTQAHWFYGCECDACGPVVQRTVGRRLTFAERRAQRWGTPVPPDAQHGPRTAARRLHGCTCEVCRPPATTRPPAGNLWGQPVPEGRVHGPRTAAYRRYGCECRVCLPSRNRKVSGGVGRAAIARRLRESKRGKPVPATVKHGPYAYKTYGCRCDICKVSNTAKRRKIEFKAGHRGRWTIGPKITTICWPPVDAGPDWQCTHEEAA